MTTQNGSYSLALGGIGGDSHSVGLFILRNALRSSGFKVHFMGIQNTLEDFFQVAPFVNAVLISTLDGHAKHYLENFPHLMKRFKPEGVRWYLGGNLDLHARVDETCQYFTELGFHQVFPKFRTVSGLDELIMKDLIQSGSSQKRPAMSEVKGLTQSLSNVGAGKLNESSFLRQRKDVLNQWSTGKAASSLKENAEFLSKSPSFSEVLFHANLKHGLLLQPRSGVALSHIQSHYFNKFQNAGIQVASYQVDSLTRNNRYREAQAEIMNSERQGTSSLNGFPVVNHGVQILRQIQTQLKIPLQIRHSTRDPRLLAEISYAGGASSYEGGCICYNLPYYKDYSLTESLERWAYVDRLTGLYYEKYGIRLNREFFGTLIATLIPPSLAIVVNLVEMLLAAEQGVVDMSLGYAEQGNRSQDIAAIRCLLPLARKYLGTFGYSKITLSTVFHQYMAAFPADLELARELIFQSGVTAFLSGATRAMTKTMVEASRVPSLQDNLDAILLIQSAKEFSRGVQVNEFQIQEEMQMIIKEVDELMESLLELGKGSLQQGLILGFQRGILDIPFSPSLYNASKVITLRDHHGAVRYFDFGQLPFSAEVKAWHQEKLSERRVKGYFQAVHQLLEEDIRFIAEGKHSSWPLGLAVQRSLISQAA